jgi:AraC-like DNA-binding protein
MVFIVETPRFGHSSGVARRGRLLYWKRHRGLFQTRDTEFRQRDITMPTHYPWSTSAPAGAHLLRPVENVLLTSEKWPAEVFENHYYDAFSWLVPVRPGELQLDIDGHRPQIGPNCWICVFPNTPYRVMEVGDGMEILALFLTHDEMLTGLTPSVPEPTVDRPFIRGNKGTIAQGLALQWAENRILGAGHRGLEKLLAPFLSAWLWSFYQQRCHEASMERFLQIKLQPHGREVSVFLRENLTESPFPWEVLARALGGSQRTLQRQLKTQLGLTPSELLSLSRIEFAKELLTKGSEDLAEIALRCGYASQSHFSTAFKMSTGATPRQWRREREFAANVL